MYGVYTVYLSRKSPNIRSYTVHIHGSVRTMYTRCLYSIFGKEFLNIPANIRSYMVHIHGSVRTMYTRCIYSIYGKEIPKYTVIYGAHTWSCQNHVYTVYIQYFWQGNPQIYGHIRCVYTVLANLKLRCPMRCSCHSMLFIISIWTLLLIQAACYKLCYRAMGLLPRLVWGVISAACVMSFRHTIGCLSCFIGHSHTHSWDFVLFYWSFSCTQQGLCSVLLAILKIIGSSSCFLGHFHTHNRVFVLFYWSFSYTQQGLCPVSLAILINTTGSLSCFLGHSHTHNRVFVLFSWSFCYTQQGLCPVLLAILIRTTGCLSCFIGHSHTHNKVLFCFIGHSHTYNRVFVLFSWSFCYTQQGIRPVLLVILVLTIGSLFCCIGNSPIPGHAKVVGHK